LSSSSFYSIQSIRAQNSPSGYSGGHIRFKWISAIWLFPFPPVVTWRYIFWHIGPGSQVEQSSAGNWIGGEIGKEENIGIMSSEGREGKKRGAGDVRWSNERGVEIE
jgi:hypothetical protein